MEEINKQESAIDDKIISLQQQVRFCFNNYDFYHKNNEMEILKEQVDRLSAAEMVYKGFIMRMRKMRKALDEGHEKCDEVDKLLENMSLTSNDGAGDEPTDDDGGDDDKENKIKPKKQMHVTFKDNV